MCWTNTIAIPLVLKKPLIVYRNTYSASLNGYTGLEMIDMFLEAGPIPDNIIFSKEWIDTDKL